MAAAQALYLFVLLFFSIYTTLLSRILVLLFVFLFFPISASTQTEGWYLSKTLNDNNGLPQNSVRSIYYDNKTGFLWLATEAGLVRYDGAEARVFDRRDMPLLQSTRIINFVPDISGKIFACTSLGEIFTIQQNYPATIIGSQAKAIEGLEYRRGNIKSLNALPVEKEILRTEKQSGEVMFNRLWLNDSLWMADTDSFITLANNQRLIHRWAKKKEDAFVYYILRNNQVYIVNAYGHGYFIDVDSKQKKQATVASDVLRLSKYGFYYDKINDRPLLISGNEVHEILFTNGIISTRLIAVLPQLPGSISAIVFDKSGRYLFVATTTNGLFIYRLSSFKIYKSAGDATENNNYGCVLVDSNHILTNRSILFNLTTGDSKKITVTISTNRMAIDSAGYIWYGPYLSCFPANNPSNIRISPSTGTNIFITAYQPENPGRLWLSTTNFFGYAQGLDMHKLFAYDSDATLHFITETPSGELLGVNEKGVYRIDTINKKLIPELTDTTVTQIRSIHIDKDHRCWIATYGNGIFLYHLKTKKLTRLPLDDKGYLQYSHVFADDNRGNFLVPTNKGMFRLSKANLLEIEAGKATALNYQYFDVSDGLLTNEFNGGCQPAYNRLPNGDVVFPALQGLVRVRLDELTQPTNVSLFIDKITTKRNTYNTPDTFYFEKEERIQTWSLGFAQWDQPNRQGIFYRLDEAGDWQRLRAGERNIQLTELKGGNHLLEIKYQYGLEPHLFTTISRKFYIGKYYYETLWFWFGIALLLLAIIYFSVRVRSRQLKQKNIRLQKIIKENTVELSEKNLQLEETLLDLQVALQGLRENSVFKDRLIGLIGHDMLLPLRFIARIANHLYDEAEALPPQVMKENNNEIKNAVTGLLYLGESLIQWIKLQEGRFHLITKTIELRQLAEEMIAVHQPMAAVKNNQLVCDVSPGLFCRYDAVFLKVILHNLLLNANKFTADGVVTVNAILVNDEIQFTVIDTGTGMNPELIASLNKGISVPSQLGTNKESGWGMGYLLIIDLLRFAGGRLNVESDLGRWTKVEFTLPLTVSEEGW